MRKREESQVSGMCAGESVGSLHSDTELGEGLVVLFHVPIYL